MIWPLRRRRSLPIDEPAWRRLCEVLPALNGLSPADALAMRALIAEFLSRKVFSGTHGLVPDDAMRLSIAAQACLPVLRRGLAAYDDFVEIVVYPSAFAVHRRITDNDGLVHEFDDILSGEAMEGGPVALSWEDAGGSERAPGTSVVIHEFVHKLDLADGVADGCPPMPAALRTRWAAGLERAYEAFVDAVEDVDASIPPDVDPESEDADAWYAELPLDPYAATDESEFFAVASEAFFVDAEGLQAAFPDLFSLFVEYFRQDPRGRALAAADPRATP